MVVDRDRQDLLGSTLADHVRVELLLDGARRRDVGRRGLRPAALLLLVDDRLAQFDALAADVDVARTLDQWADVAVAAAAERAVRVAVAAGGAGRAASARITGGAVRRHWAPRSDDVEWTGGSCQLFGRPEGHPRSGGPIFRLIILAGTSRVARERENTRNRAELTAGPCGFCPGAPARRWMVVVAIREAGAEPSGAARAGGQPCARPRRRGSGSGPRPGAAGVGFFTFSATPAAQLRVLPPR